MSYFALYYPMKSLYIYGISFIIILCSATCKNKKTRKPEKTISVAFYNLDNLFDTEDDNDHLDDEFTPKGTYKWDNTRFNNKLENMEKVISQIAEGNSPDILGVCELESKTALNALINTGKLKNQYSYAHFDSPDERGIDVALLFKNKLFKLIKSLPLKVSFTKTPNDKTRDILHCQLEFIPNKEIIHFFVCHYPSRREGKDESEQNRLDASNTLKNYIDSNIDKDKDNIVIMGDFNDEPWDKSIKDLGSVKIDGKKEGEFYNLMYKFIDQKRGTYKFRDKMNILDQFIISKKLYDKNGVDYITNSAEIMDLDWMKQKGKYEGFPLRTFGGNEWLNGYSDHFPIYFYLTY